MPQLNFKKRFADDVENLRKRQTIRAKRKDGRDPKPGDDLYLYTGLRTKACRKLGEVVCVNVSPLHIGEHFTVVKGVYAFEPDEIKALAKADGFKDEVEFFDFFREEHGLPFYGLLIEW